MSGEEDSDAFFYVLQDAIRILFVDDDPILREFATVHLSSDKAEVAVAEDGRDALEMLHEEPFDLALLDLEMPRMDGFEALEALRRDARTRDLPVIVVTGREDVAAIDRAFKAGADSFVVKPINWRQLSYQIRFVHRARQAEHALSRVRAEARDRARRDADGLRRLAREASDLIRLAVTGGGELRQAALNYALLLSEVAAPSIEEPAQASSPTV